MIVAEEAAMGTQRTGMGGAENQVSGGIYEAGLTPCWCPPEEEHQSLALTAECLDDGIGKLLPSLSAMAESLMGPDGETGVEQEHPLPRPASEVAACGDSIARLALYLLEDVTQGGRKLHAILNGETKSVGLADIVVGVLPKDNHLHLLKGRLLEGIEYEPSRWEAWPCAILSPHKLHQLCKVGLLKLPLQPLFPRRFYPNVHTLYIYFGDKDTIKRVKCQTRLSIFERKYLKPQVKDTIKRVKCQTLTPFITIVHKFVDHKLVYCDYS